MDQKATEFNGCFWTVFREIVILSCSPEVVPVSGRTKAPAVSASLAMGRLATLHAGVSEELGGDWELVELGFE